MKFIPLLLALVPIFADAAQTRRRYPGKPGKAQAQPACLASQQPCVRGSTPCCAGSICRTGRFSRTNRYCLPATIAEGKPCGFDIFEANCRDNLVCRPSGNGDGTRTCQQPGPRPGRMMGRMGVRFAAKKAAAAAAAKPGKPYY